MSRAWLQSNSRPRPAVDLHMDAGEGRFVDMSCLHCGATGVVVAIAAPAAMYMASLDCRECGTQLLEFDAIHRHVMRYDGQDWRAA